MWGRLWEPFIKPALGFQTSKQVRLNDWRLGVCLRVAQILVLSYTVYDVVRSPKCVDRGGTARVDKYGMRLFVVVLPATADVDRGARQ